MKVKLRLFFFFKCFFKICSVEQVCTSSYTKGIKCKQEAF